MPLTTEHCIKRLSCSHLPRSLQDTSLPLPVTQRIDRMSAQPRLYIGLSAFPNTEEGPLAISAFEDSLGAAGLLLEFRA